MSRTRTDGNQKEIIEKWMKIPGASYVDLHNVRNGCPDVLLGYGGFNFLFEIKNEGGVLTDHQIEFFKTHTGQVGLVYYFGDITKFVHNFLSYCAPSESIKFKRYAEQIFGSL